MHPRLAARWGPHVGLVVSLLVVLVGASPAYAESAGGPRVAIVTGRGERAALRWLTAELRSHGFESVVLKGESGAASPSRLRAAAVDNHAVATITIAGHPPPRRVDLWVVRGGRFTLAGVVTADDSGSHRLIALRIVELLRANMIAVPRVEATERHRAPPGSDERSPPRLVLSVDGGASFAPGGLSPMGHVWVGAALRATSWLDFELVGLVPVAPGMTSEPEGEAQVYCGLVGVDARFLFSGPEARLRPSLAGGVGLLLVHASGEPAAVRSSSAPTFGSSGWAFAAAPYLRAGLSLRLTARLRIRGNALVGVAMPRPAIDFVGRQVAAWGRPFVSVALGLGLAL